MNIQPVHHYPVEGIGLFDMARHRHQAFIRFLNAMNLEVPVDTTVPVILDNYAAHKHPRVLACLDRHPRFTFHFTPTSATWPPASLVTPAGLHHAAARGRFCHPGLVEFSRLAG